MQEILLSVSVMCLLILLLIFLLKKLRQPYLVAYILAGFILGPHVSGLFNKPEDISSLGEIGILLLMFFLGVEIEIPDKRNLLLQPFIAQTVKTVLSVLCALLIGAILHWKAGNILILSILLTFNSTAVVSETLHRSGELGNRWGKMILNILLLQDIMLAPAFTLFQFTGRPHIDISQLTACLGGCLLIFLLLNSIRNGTLFQLYIWKEIEKDHDLQVFAGSLICLGFALLASLCGLSGPVGSFAAGVYIGRTRIFQWLGRALQPFKVFFVALYFVSIGLMLDVEYIQKHYVIILSITFLVLLTNSLLSALVFRLLKYSWKSSFYAGALLSQTGELGVLASSLAYRSGIISLDFFKTSVAVTGLTLLLSTGWITVLRYVTIGKGIGILS